jgi:lipopolysaccharide transport system permease protein
MSNSMFQAFSHHPALIAQMVKREVFLRYRGSVLGLFWSFLNPLLMLGLYSFVFTVVFKPRWEQALTSQAEYVLILFCGLTFHSFLAEILQRSPMAIVSNTNFVKKVMFPLEILPLIVIGSALFHLAISSGVLFLFALFVNHSLPWTVVFFPVVLLPFALLTCGVAWLLASLGVYLRDVSQIMGLVTSVLLFMSPILFPTSALPEQFRPLLYLNPLTFVVEQMREIIIWGHAPYWLGLCVYSAVSLLLMWLGFWWFEKTRKGFADVL